MGPGGEAPTPTPQPSTQSPSSEGRHQSPASSGGGPGVQQNWVGQAGWDPGLLPVLLDSF